ncbi:MAG: HepT-like ribonuclease domain-containing protein [Patescibacteria group bacterium]|nr:HepT-like ribonuclease domain-containing protein [Patescibacteria group bacterium]
MTKLKLEKDIIIKRLEGIEAELNELKRLSDQEFTAFSAGDGWKLAQFHLHRALEGVFNIGSHIISRIPGATASQYKEIAIKLAESKIIPADFANNQLVKMAKYRNRLVHFYAQISTEELYRIIHDDLGDFEIFLSAIKIVLTNPEKFGLEAE